MERDRGEFAMACPGGPECLRVVCLNGGMVGVPAVVAPELGEAFSDGERRELMSMVAQRVLFPLFVGAIQRDEISVLAPTLSSVFFPQERVEAMLLLQ